MRIAITQFRAVFRETVPAQWRVITPESSLPELFDPGSQRAVFGAAGSPEGVVLPLHEFGPPLLGAAGLSSSAQLNPERLAVVIGSSKGAPHRIFPWAEQGSGPDAEDAPWTWSGDWPALRIAQLTGALGPCLAPAAACASGAHALALAAQLLQDGRTDAVLAGSTEEGLSGAIMAGYRRLGALSRTGVMRPFDRRRDGFVPNAGAGVFLLEREESARARGAEILGYLTGWSLLADATHLTALCPSGETIARAIHAALRRAGRENVDYVNAHGTATRVNDMTESRGIAAALGSGVPVSSTKGLTGHLLGAAGAVEAALCVLAMRQGFAPPTVGLEERDEAGFLDYIPLRGRAMPVAAALSLNYGFGGHIGALVFERA